jgi:hypothetical protein
MYHHDLLRATLTDDRRDRIDRQAGLWLTPRRSRRLRRASSPGQ